MKMKFIKSLVVAAIVTLISPAQASLMVYEYNSFVDATAIGLGSNEQVAVRYSFESTAVETWGSSFPKLGTYNIIDLAVSLGGETVNWYPGGSRAEIKIYNDNSFDAYFVEAVPFGVVGANFSGSIRGLTVYGVGFNISDLGTGSWSDDSLVLSTQVLNALDSHNGFGLNLRGDNGNFDIFSDNDPSFTITDVTPGTAVPEPGTLALLGIALAGLGVGRRHATRLEC